MPATIMFLQALPLKRKSGGGERKTWKNRMEKGIAYGSSSCSSGVILL